MSAGWTGNHQVANRADGARCGCATKLKSVALANSWHGVRRKTAADTPHTITNALMTCFSSETDIAGGGVRRVKQDSK